MIIFNSNKPDVELIAPDISWGLMGEGYQDMRPSKWELFDPTYDVWVFRLKRKHATHHRVLIITELLGWVKHSVRWFAMTTRCFEEIVEVSSGRPGFQSKTCAWLGKLPSLEGILVIDKGYKRHVKRGEVGIQKLFDAMRTSWEKSDNGLRDDGYADKWKMPKLKYVKDMDELKIMTREGIGSQSFARAVL